MNSTQSWHDGPLLHRGPAAYSDMVDLGGGRVGVLFEAGEMGQHKYDCIKFIRLKTGQMVVTR